MIRHFPYTNSKHILILSVSLLSMLGLWVLSDAFALFFQGNVVTNGTWWHSSVFFRQVLGIMTGVIIFIAIQFFDFKFILKYRWVWPILSLLVLLIIIDNGQSKFILLHPFDIRYGLLFTLFMVFYFISFLRNGEVKRLEFYFFIGWVIFLGGILTLSGDIYMADIFILTAVIMLYVTGKRKAALFLLAAAAVFTFLFVKIYFFENLKIYYTYWGDRKFYQVRQSVRCIRAGGFWGRGPAGPYLSMLQMNPPEINGQIFRLHLPDFDSGFIFAVAAFLFGMPGAALILIAYAALIFLGIKAARQAGTESSALLLLVLTFIFAANVFAGMATPLGLLPPNSEGLPLFSAGMSRTVFAFFTFGVIYRNLGKGEGNSDIIAVDYKYVFTAVSLMFIVITGSLLFLYI